MMDRIFAQRCFTLDENLEHPRCEKCGGETKAYSVDNEFYEEMKKIRPDLIASNYFIKYGFSKEAMENEGLNIVFMCSKCIPLYDEETNERED